MAEGILTIGLPDCGAKNMSLLSKLPHKKKPEPEPIKFEPDTETPDTGTPDFVEIGGSPVPGLTLRHVLRGHAGAINRIAWSLDGKYLASPSNDKTIRIWDVSAEKCIRVLEGHDDSIISVAWSSLESPSLVSASNDHTIRLWEDSGKNVGSLGIAVN